MILKILDDIAKHNSKKDKEAILKKARDRSPHFTSVILFALDPYRRYHIRKFDPVKAAKKSVITWPIVFKHFETLAQRAVTGHAARDLVTDILSKLDKADGEVARRILLKDLRCGVNTKIVNNVWKKFIPDFALQFAEPFDADWLEFPMAAEIKWDGMRVVAVVDRAEVEFLSRGGRPVNTLDHLAKDLLRLAPKGGVFDGEALAPGRFEDAISAIKRGAPKEGVAGEFSVFDFLELKEWRARFCDRPYAERRATLNMLFSRYSGHMMRVGEATIVNTLEEVDQKFNEAREKGYEGLILKEPLGMYSFKRTRSWMKVKASDTIDVVITGAREGEKKNVGKLGAIEFKYKGADCRAGTGFSDKQRVEFWQRHIKPIKGTVPLVGLVAEVEFTELTGKGRTRHARFVRLREHGGERD